jgi:hypothetical protein
LLALLAHHFLHVSRIRDKSLTLRLLMSYIYMECIFLMFLDHTQRRSTVGRTPLDERSARRRDLYLTTRYSQQTNIHTPGGSRTHDLNCYLTNQFLCAYWPLFYICHKVVSRYPNHVSRVKVHYKAFVEFYLSNTILLPSTLHQILGSLT